MRAPRAGALLGALALLLVGGVLLPGPAEAARREIRLTTEGPVPASLTVAKGDTIRFVNVDTFPHRAVDSAGAWDFDTGPLLPGQVFDVPTALTASGTYSYEGADLDDFTGVVVVPAPRIVPRPAAPAPAPAPPASPAPRPAAPAPAAPAPTASPTPVGTGRVDGPPPLAGGVLPPPAALPTPAPPDPLVAQPDSPLPDAAPDAGPDAVVPPPPVTVPVATGDLPGLGTAVDARRVGLPAALGLVLLGGVVSLLVRLLLAMAPRPL